MDPSSFLFEHEFQYLLATLRRDLRAELEKANQSDGDADYHRQNARAVQRLREALDPRCE